MQILLKKMSLVNFKGIRSAEFDFNPTVNTVLGDNATGENNNNECLFVVLIWKGY
jgi:recombinational DNA repair ATPase RecF